MNTRTRNAHPGSDDRAHRRTIHWMVLLMSLLTSFAALAATGTVAYATGAGSLNYYYNHDGSPTWNPSQVRGAGYAYSAPAIVHSSRTDNTEMVVEGPNQTLDYYYNHDGKSGWSESAIKGASTDATPAIAYNDVYGNTEIAVQGANHTLYYYYNHDGTPGWSGGAVSGPGAYSAPAIVHSDSTDNTEIAAEGPTWTL